MNLLIAFQFVLLACPYPTFVVPAQTEQPSCSEFDQIRLVRTVCFGSCPEYSITIFRDGRVLYEGRRFVRKKGKARTRLSQAQLCELRNGLEDVDFFSLRDTYTSYLDGCPRNSTDNPSAITTVTRGGRTKTITHDLGCRSADSPDELGGSLYPEALAHFEDLIDKVTNSKEWVEIPQ